MTVIDLTGLAASDGFIIQGDAAGDHAGFSVLGPFSAMMAAPTLAKPM